MIALEHLKKYKEILDKPECENYSKDEEEFMNSVTWREIGELRQNLTIVVENLGSKEFNEMTQNQLKRICKNEEVINELHNIIKYFE
jgi:hypothetical protein